MALALGDNTDCMLPPNVVFCCISVLFCTVPNLRGISLTKVKFIFLLGFCVGCRFSKLIRNYTALKRRYSVHTALVKYQSSCDVIGLHVMSYCRFHLLGSIPEVVLYRENSRRHYEGIANGYQKRALHGRAQAGGITKILQFDVRSVLCLAKNKHKQTM